MKLNLSQTDNLLKRRDLKKAYVTINGCVSSLDSITYNYYDSECIYVSHQGLVFGKLTEGADIVAKNYHLDIKIEGLDLSLVLPLPEWVEHFNRKYGKENLNEYELLSWLEYSLTETPEKLTKEARKRMLQDIKYITQKIS